MLIPSPFGETGVGSIALMKKGLKPKLAAVQYSAFILSWKYCPDEEGIETCLSNHTARRLYLRWKYCPDEEGIETQLSSPLSRRPSIPVGSIALMKKGLKLTRYQIPVQLALYCWKYCPDEEGIETQLSSPLSR